MEKRKDTKGRNLWAGESQRNDGRYEFKYTDNTGNRRSVYSWRLVETDKTPAGKHEGASLRSLETQIQKDLLDGIDRYQAHKITLDVAFEESLKMRKLKSSTLVNYRYMYYAFVSKVIGTRTLDSIRCSDIIKLYNHLMSEKGFRPNTVEVVNTILHPIFRLAVKDSLIRTNPCDGVIEEIKKSHMWETPKRHALTKTQQAAFLSTIRSSETLLHWMPVITVMLGTGCRIGELIGLTWSDCDFDHGIININHNLIYRKENTPEGKCRYHITTPKTKAGVRVIPMLDEVKEALLTEKERQSVCGECLDVIDGYSGFVFTNRYRHVLSPSSINRAISRILALYNTAEKESTAKEVCEFIPHITAHNLRHTFCTRFCENETNLKVIQEIMGHADIATTMDVYNEATRDEKISSFEHLQGKMQIN